MLCLHRGLADSCICASGDGQAPRVHTPHLQSYSGHTQAQEQGEGEGEGEGEGQCDVGSEGQGHYRKHVDLTKYLRRVDSRFIVRACRWRGVHNGSPARGRSNAHCQRPLRGNRV